MIGKCEICGFNAGVFNLKDGRCKSCRSADKSTDSLFDNEVEESKSFIGVGWGMLCVGPIIFVLGMDTEFGAIFGGIVAIMGFAFVALGSWQRNELKKDDSFIQYQHGIGGNSGYTSFATYFCPNCDEKLKLKDIPMLKDTTFSCPKCGQQIKR